jgi:hypothetical protein
MNNRGDASLEQHTRVTQSPHPPVIYKSHGDENN